MTGTTGAMTMPDFEELLHATVQDQANPMPPSGFEQRIMARLATGSPHAAEQGTEQAGSVWTRFRGLVSPQTPQPQTGLFQSASTDRNSSPFLAAFAVHALAILLIGYLIRQHTALLRPTPSVQVVTLDAPPPKVRLRSVASGGGGGQRGPTPVTRGTPPRFADYQIVPPSTPPLVEPKIRMEPTIEVQRDLKMANSVPQIGVANSPLIGMSMGKGRGTGLGSGIGAGLGPGSGGNNGGGARRIGGGISAPILVYSVEPEFSEEARKAKAMGNVLVNLWVDQNGNPSHVRILRGVGMGLDEKAIAAVRQYRFRPALENGEPVTVELNVEVTFQIF